MKITQFRTICNHWNFLLDIRTYDKLSYIAIWIWHTESERMLSVIEFCECKKIAFISIDNIVIWWQFFKHEFISQRIKIAVWFISFLEDLKLILQIRRWLLCTRKNFFISLDWSFIFDICMYKACSTLFTV